MNKQQTTVRVPISGLDRNLAKQYTQGVNLFQGKQIYLNLLAVRTVEFYLNCLGIATNRKQSDSYDSMLVKFFDTADLWIEDYGRIEVRPLFPDETSCPLPAEVRFDRLAYLLVRFNDQLSEAEILGFTPTAKTTITVEDLQSMSEFMKLLQSHSETYISPLNCLGNWLKGSIEQGWKNLDSVLTTNHLTPSAVRHLCSPTAAIKQAKIINVGLELNNFEIILAITLIPKEDETIKVKAQVFPELTHQYLPENLQLAMLSQTGEILQQVWSRSHDNYIQLKPFSGDSGDRFDLQLGYNQVKIIESFIF